ncbi:unnamed protein product [Staurois parvus]|uniref:Uncharacterized protein n=1 Tax=Staurois parvus TaxID=386267 RepID=A0ABN9CNS9_9NEOB|nr:unnamed protein product [Staurois parvus]
MGPCTASSCCCQVQSLSWVPVRPPIAAVSIATLCHVPLSGLLTLLVGSIFCHRVLYGLHCCCLLHRHTVAPHSGCCPIRAPIAVPGPYSKGPCTALICMSADQTQ